MKAGYESQSQAGEEAGAGPQPTLAWGLTGSWGPMSSSPVAVCPHKHLARTSGAQAQSSVSESELQRGGSRPGQECGRMYLTLELKEPKTSPSLGQSPP